MKRPTYLLLCVAFIVGFLVIGTITANAQRQRLLGTKNIADRLDRDTIPVTGFQGDVRRIRFRVTWRPVRIYRCQVVFRNFRRQDCNINQLIRPGRYTRWIDLRGNERVIRNVVLWYDAKSIGRGEARIWLFGQD